MRLYRVGLVNFNNWSGFVVQPDQLILRMVVGPYDPNQNRICNPDLTRYDGVFSTSEG